MFHRNAVGAPLICAACGGHDVRTLAEIGLRWKTVLFRMWEGSFREHLEEEGREIPDGYGIAYYELGRDACVIMPVPFNLIVGGWRAFCRWFWLPP